MSSSVETESRLMVPPGMEYRAREKGMYLLLGTNIWGLKKVL